MAGDVRERIDPGLDLKMEQNGALERFFVELFFLPFFLFLFLPKPRTEALWGRKRVYPFSHPLPPPKPSLRLQTQGIHKLLPLPLVHVGLMKNG